MDQELADQSPPSRNLACRERQSVVPTDKEGDELATGFVARAGRQKAAFWEGGGILLELEGC